MARVRVFVANLAWYARVKGGEVRRPFGILNPAKLREGKRQYVALGGGAMLTGYGVKTLQRSVSADDFEVDAKTGFYDARFVVAEDEVELVMQAFAQVDENGSTVFESDPTLDIMAELSGKEFPGYSNILTPDEVGYVEPRFVKVVRQKLPAIGADTSSRANVDMPTHRLFRIFELEMPSQVFWQSFFRSPVVRLLSQEELETTNGGSSAGLTKDGLVIQNNLFV